MTFSINRRHILAGMGAAGAMAAFGRQAFANTKVNLGVMRLGSHAPSYIAFERGYFKDEGLDVELKYFEAAQAMAVAIASGDADYAVTALSGGLASLAEKGAIKVIGGALAEEKGVKGNLLLASKQAFDAGLKSAADLKGRSFGITTAGSSFHYMCHKIAQANNIAMSDITLRPLQKVGALAGALSTGQIDSWCIQANVANRLLADGSVHQIGVVSDFVPNYQVTTVFTSTKNASDERAKTEAFLRAYSRAIADYNAAMVDKTASQDEVDAIAAIVHKYVDADSPAEQAKETLISGAMRVNEGCALSLDSVKDQLKWFQDEGMVSEAITPELLFDTSYVKII